VHTYDQLLARTDAPPGSSWGLFGEHSDLGTINFLTPERVLAGIRCVRQGTVFNLDLELDAFDPPLSADRGGPNHVIFQLNPNHRDEYLDGFYPQGSSQIDGLRHFRNPDHGFYDGAPDEEIAVGTARLGMQALAEHGIVGRGVLLDVGRYLEQQGQPLDYRSPQPIPVDALEATAASQSVGLETGDIILLRTGWLSFVLYEMSRAERQASRGRWSCPGLRQSHDTVRWLWDRQIPLIAADNLAVECYPPIPDSPFISAAEAQGAPRSGHSGMMHRVVIPLLGLALGELWQLDPLADDCARDGVWEFLVAASPLNLRGGVGSPANALAVK